METKLSILKTYAFKNDWKKAIAIAAKFPNLGDERNAILDAHTAYTNPRWTIQMGRDVNATINLGIKALIIRYNLEDIV